MSGRADYLELGDFNAVCYQCGRKRKASTLVRNWQGYYVCHEHNEPRQSQDFVRSVPDVQTPPWVQPLPADTFTTTTYTVSVDSTGWTTVDGTQTAVNGVVPLVLSGTTIISIQATGLAGGQTSISSLVLTGSGTTTINNYGIVTGVTDSSTATVTVNNYGYYSAGPQQFTLTAAGGNQPVHRGFAIAGYVNGQVGAITPSELFGLTIGVLCSDNTNAYFLVSGTQTQSLFASIRFYYADGPIDYTAYSIDAAVSSVSIGADSYTQFYWADFDPFGVTGDYQITITP